MAGKGTIPGILMKAIICKEYGWDEYQYDNASEEFIEAIIARREVEAVMEKREMDKHKT